jgi:hypothetical protein
MSGTRALTLSAHAAIETVAAPAIMAAPFLLGFGQAASALALAIGAMLLGLALQTVSPGRTISLSSHAAFDYVLAALAIVGGLVIGLGGGEWDSASFLVGIGVALVALTASTRFTIAVGA